MMRLWDHRNKYLLNTLYMLNAVKSNKDKIPYQTSGGGSHIPRPWDLDSWRLGCSGCAPPPPLLDDLSEGKGLGLVQLTLCSTRLGQLGANISPDRSSLTPQVLIGNVLFNPFVVCHKYWEKLYELQHINLLSLYLPKEDGVSPDVEYITQQIIFSIFLQW